MTHDGFMDQVEFGGAGGGFAVRKAIVTDTAGFYLAVTKIISDENAPA